MPAKVDAEDRRRLLVLAAAELIADEGINALTNTKIAKRLSGSTTMVTHYFPSKRELVLDTYQTMASRSRARVEQAMRESDDPLAACLRALLPLDDPSRLEWKVWLAYQGMSVGDPELMRIWASRAASAVDRVTRLIEADISAGRMPSGWKNTAAVESAMRKVGVFQRPAGVAKPSFTKLHSCRRPC